MRGWGSGLVAAHSVAVFRMALGLVLAWSMVRYLSRGWVTTQLTGPEFHVTYPGLWWVRPLPAPWMHLLLVVVALAGVAVALGLRTRWAAAVALVGFCWIEFADASTYLNHYELVTLLLAWAVVVPLDRAWSLDRRRGRVRGPASVPVRVIWILQAQLAVVYLFAGLAKLDGEWLLQGEPLATWLAARSDLAVLGPVVALPWAPFVAAWAGAAFDLSVVPLLLWRRTRAPAYLAVVGFHLVTWRLFPAIGVFPWAMIALTPVFFAPDWPVRVLSRLRRGVAPALPAAAPSRAAPLGRGAVVALAVVAVLQLLIPARHLVVPGDVRWDEVHYRWSWRVMLNERAGSAAFDLVDPVDGTTTRVYPSDLLAPHQVRYVSSRPEALRQLAHHLADAEERRTGVRPEVHVSAWVVVNRHPRALVVDPAVDLAAEESSWWAPAWVEPAPWAR